MPNYEFSCAACGEGFTMEMTVSERGGAQISCPACGSRETNQVFRAVHINTRKASCDEAGGCGAGCGGCCREC